MKNAGNRKVAAVGKKENDKRRFDRRPRIRRFAPSNSLAGESGVITMPVFLMHSKPQVLVWITCDGVHIDPGSGKHTLLGVFSNIRSRQFPVVHPFMIWFLTISDVPVGNHKIRISLGLDHASLSPLIEREIESQGPLQRINLINEVRNFNFVQAGDYSILVEVDDEPLLATSLTVSA